MPMNNDRLSQIVGNGESPAPAIGGWNQHEGSYYCEISTLLNTLPTGEHQYSVYPVEPKFSIVEGVLKVEWNRISTEALSPIISMNGYKWFAGDIAKIDFSRTGQLVLTGTGTFETGVSGYGYYFAE